MKLSEIKSTIKEARGFTEVFKDLDLWQGVGSKTNMASADVEVEYDYEGPSHSDHPYGEGTAREHHGSTVGILSVKLLQDADEYNDEDEKTGVLKKGTDLLKQSWWDNKWTDWLANQIAERME